MIHISDELKAKQPLLYLGIVTTPKNIDYESYRELETCFEYISYKDRDIYLRVLGWGGYVEHSMSIVDLTRLHDVTGILVGAAYSGSSIIWAGCPKRYVMPNGLLQVHQASVVHREDAVDTANSSYLSLLNLMEDNKTMIEIYSDACASPNHKASYWGNIFTVSSDAGLKRYNSDAIVNELQMGQPITMKDFYNARNFKGISARNIKLNNKSMG